MTFCLLGQDAPEAAPEATGMQSIFGNPFVPIIGVFFLYYFIVIAPDRRKKREEAEMKSSLKKNDRIVTIGGIHGTVVAAPEGTGVVTIRIDESGNTKMKINRTAIATIINDKESADGAVKEPDSETKTT